MPVNIALQIKTSVVKKIISLLWLWTPVFIWMGMIFYSSSLIMEESKIDVPNIDKLFHFIEYFILGYLWTRALTYTSSNPNYLYIFIAAVICSFSARSGWVVSENLYTVDTKEPMIIALN